MLQKHKTQEEDKTDKTKPAAPAIAVDNPNRSKPEHVKVADLEKSMAKTDLSRRERYTTSHTHLLNNTV